MEDISLQDNIDKIIRQDSKESSDPKKQFTTTLLIGAKDWSSAQQSDQSLVSLSEPQIEQHPPLFGTTAPESVFKVIFIGDSNVGKSSVISRFCSNSFSLDLGSTVGVDFKNRLFHLKGVSINLQCWDTAGQERYRAVTKQYFRRSDAVVIVYDIGNEQSFLNAREWIQSAKEAVTSGYVESEDNALYLILGNKADLGQGRRQIKENQGHILAKHYGAKFAEISAATGQNIEESLFQLAADLHQKQEMELANSSNPSIINLKPVDRKKKKCC